LGYTNLYAYDAARRKICETNADGQILRYTNSPAGDLLSLTDGKGQTTQWRYDLYGRVTNKLDQAGTVILKYQYDADNRLTNRWSAAKNNTGYAYDHVGNLTNVAYPVSPAQRYQYDALNRLTNMVDAVGTTAYTYTSGGFLHTEDGPFASDTLTNYYNNRLRVGLGLQQPTGSWTNGFTYDEAKRLTSVTSPAGTFDYAYDSTRLRLVDQFSLPNSSYITNTYDPVARLLGTFLKNSSGTTLDAASYGYNAGNQRTNFLNATGTNVAYTYDPIGQLTNAASAVSTETCGYVYDAAWNLTNLNNAGTATNFVLTSRNELSSVGGLYFDYDLNGNLTSSFTISGTIITTTYSYDDENRLISAQTLVGTTQGYLTTLAYDGLGRLREQIQYILIPPTPGHFGPTPEVDGTWEETGATYYVYDGKRVIQERDTNNVPTVGYTRGNDLSGTLEGAGGIGGMLARSSGYSSGSFTTNLYYHADGNGNIAYLVNSSQTLAASYQYDPYGNLLNSSGAYATANTYRFSSKEYSPSTSLYIYLYRFYSPQLQRWLNRDPIGEAGGINLYGFVGNNPMSFVDPLGLLVFGTFDIGTGTLAFTDEDTGQTVVIKAESGGKPWGDPIPVGNYDVLDHPKLDFLRLEPLDGHYGDDKDEATGRNKFRLHKPGNTIGCIAAKEKAPWQKLRDLIRSTKTTTTQVDNKSYNPFAPPQETIKKFGELRVIDTTKMMIIPPGIPPKP